MILTGVEQISYKDRETGAPCSFYVLYSSSKILANGTGDKVNLFSLSEQVLTDSGYTLGDLIEATQNGYQVFGNSRSVAGRNYMSDIVILPS